MMRLIVPDITPLIDDIDHLAAAFDLTAFQLGVRLIRATVEAITIHCMQETDPNGQPWEALSAGYVAWKDTVAPDAQIGVLYGTMLAPEQLEGEWQIEPDRAAVTYGVDDIARTEAWKFQEGGIVTGTSQPPRPFYEINTTAVIAVAAVFDDHFIRRTT